LTGPLTGPGTGSAEQQVLAAATALVEAFGRHDTAAYFTAFRRDATFSFHTHPEPLRSRAAYEELWRSWEADGFRVLGCTSSEQHVQLLGATEDVAVFTHRVATRVRPGTGHAEESLDERETIVFARGDDGWVAVHEHLSPRQTG
jgi:ketosteroid isomerase-like protein